MIAYEYAKAIFELASSNNKEELVNDNFNLFIKLINDNPDYFKILTYPRITIKEKKDSLKNTLLDFEDIFLNFLYVVLDNNKMNIIRDIAFEYEKLILIDNGAVSVDVFSANKLNKQELKSVENALIKTLNKKRIFINNIVDESLIGGIKAVYNGKAIDISLNSRLDSLKKSL